MSKDQGKSKFKNRIGNLNAVTKAPARSTEARKCRLYIAFAPGHRVVLIAAL